MKNSNKQTPSNVLTTLAKENGVPVDDPFNMYVDAFKCGNYDLAERLYDLFVELQDRFDTVRVVICDYIKYQEKYIEELEFDLKAAITYIEITTQDKIHRKQFKPLSRCKKRLDTLGVQYE